MLRPSTGKETFMSFLGISCHCYHESTQSTIPGIVQCDATLLLQCSLGLGCQLCTKDIAGASLHWPVKADWAQEPGLEFGGCCHCQNCPLPIHPSFCPILSLPYHFCPFPSKLLCGLTPVSILDLSLYSCSPLQQWPGCMLQQCCACNSRKVHYASRIMHLRSVP